MSPKARRASDDAHVESFTWEPVEAAPGTSPSAGSSVGGHRSAEPVDQRARLSAIEREAFAKGYAQGERAGAEASATRADAMLRRLAQTLEELAALRAEIIRRTERQMVQLIVAIAERVVQREIT